MKMRAGARLRRIRRASGLVGVPGWFLGAQQPRARRWMCGGRLRNARQPTPRRRVSSYNSLEVVVGGSADPESTLPALQRDRVAEQASEPPAQPAAERNSKAVAGTERITLAALAFAATRFAKRRPATPKDGQAFTELAEWVLSNLEVGCGPSRWDCERSVNGLQAQSAGPDDTYFAALTQRLLAINRDATAALMSQPPRMFDTHEHNARQLWQSIPLPLHSPVVRQGTRVGRGAIRGAGRGGQRFDAATPQRGVPHLVPNTSLPHPVLQPSTSSGAGRSSAADNGS